eukprot:507838_1
MSVSIQTMSFSIHFELLVYALSLINAQIIPSYDKLCASGSTHLSVDGTFSNPIWHSELNGATYHNEKASQYLFPYIATGGYRYLMIAKNPMFTTIASLSYYCNIGVKTNNYIFNIDDCFNQWNYLSNGKEMHDTNMTVVNCNDIRVTSNDHFWLNGIYLWKMFINNYSVYYCKECDEGYDTHDGSYLHGWINPDGSYWWVIGAEYSSGTGWISCLLGYDLGSDYLFNIENCQEWRTFNGTSWILDEDMTVGKRVPCDTNIINEHCLYVDMYPSSTLPTSNTIQIQNNNDELNTYFYIFFKAYDMDCVYPKIEFEFEKIDTDSSHEYIHIINDNGSLISNCGGATENDCGVFEQCFTDISIGVNKIKMNETYQILITESPHVDALCLSHNYSINAKLTLTCSVPILTNNPTNAPSNMPTTNPIVIPTIYPSKMPIEISYIPTMFPTKLLTTNENTETITGIKKISSKTNLIIAVITVGLVLIL